MQVNVRDGRDPADGRKRRRLIRGRSPADIGPQSEGKPLDDHSPSAQEIGRTLPRHGKPAGIFIGFESEDDWFNYRLQSDPRFLRRIQAARRSLRRSLGTKLEDLDVA